MSFVQTIEIIKLIILIVSGAAIPIVIFVIGNRYAYSGDVDR